MVFSLLQGPVSLPAALLRVRGLRPSRRSAGPGLGWPSFGLGGALWLVVRSFARPVAVLRFCLLCAVVVGGWFGVVVAVVAFFFAVVAPFWSLRVVCPRKGVFNGRSFRLIDLGVVLHRLLHRCLRRQHYTVYSGHIGSRRYVLRLDYRYLCVRRLSRYQATLSYQVSLSSII